MEMIKETSAFSKAEISKIYKKKKYEKKEISKWANECELLKQQARRNGCDYANLIQTGKLRLGGR